MHARRLIVAAVLISVFAVAQVSDGYYSKGLDKLWNEIIAASRAGNRDGALAALAKAHALAPEDEQIAMNYAAGLARRGKSAEARVIFGKIAARVPSVMPVGDPDFGGMAKDPAFAEAWKKFEAANQPIVRSEVAFTIPERDLIPEGIACDPRTGALYVGSIAKRKVVKIAPDGKISDLTQPDANLWNVIGMKVDPERPVLWAATAASTERGAKERGSALVEISLSDGSVLRRFAVNDDEMHLFNDLDFGADGNLYFTDSLAGALWVLRKDAKQVEKVLPSGTFFYPNGIVELPGGKRLLVANFGPGITVVDLATKKLSKLPHDAATTTGGIDGMYLDGRSILGVVNSNGPERVVRFHMNAGMDRIERTEVLERRHPKYNPPTTGAIAGHSFYTLANAQLRAYEGGKIKSGAKLEDVVILKMPLDGGKATE